MSKKTYDRDFSFEIFKDLNILYKVFPDININTAVKKISSKNDMAKMLQSEKQ
jgi:hypothetical protein